MHHTVVTPQVEHVFAQVAARGLVIVEYDNPRFAAIPPARQPDTSTIVEAGGDKYHDKLTHKFLFPSCNGYQLLAFILPLVPILRATDAATRLAAASEPTTKR